MWTTTDAATAEAVTPDGAYDDGGGGGGDFASVNDDDLLHHHHHRDFDHQDCLFHNQYTRHHHRIHRHEANGNVVFGTMSFAGDRKSTKSQRLPPHSQCLPPPEEEAMVWMMRLSLSRCHRQRPKPAQSMRISDAVDFHHCCFHHWCRAIRHANRTLCRSIQRTSPDDRALACSKARPLC